MITRHLTWLALAAALAATPLQAGEATIDPGTARFQAERGNVIAQFNLGIAYAEGRGIAADPIEAFVWLSFATENGTGGRQLDNLIGNLTSEQYEEGTLSSISQRYYGTPSRWQEILAANSDVLRGSTSLVAGRTLRIP